MTPAHEVTSEVAYDLMHDTSSGTGRPRARWRAKKPAKRHRRPLTSSRQSSRDAAALQPLHRGSPLSALSPYCFFRRRR